MKETFQGSKHTLTNYIMTDINLNFRPYFDELNYSKKNFALCHATLFIKSLNLKELLPDQQVLKLSKVLELHKKKIDDFKNKEYFNFADDDNQLYNVFIAYSLFYHRNEEAILEECFILNETYKLLNQRLQDTIAQLPQFTYLDLLNNKKNVVFYELNQQPFGTSDEEYARMRNWQTNQKVSPNSSFDQLVDPTFEEGICQGKKAIAEFESKYFSQKIKEDKYQSVCLHKQNKIRSGFKLLVYPEYYQFLPERENVKRIFLNHCIENIDIEDHQLELIKTIVLFEKNKFIDHELLMMDREVICTSIDYDFIVHQMNNMLSIMVPDCELIYHWQQAWNGADKSMVNRMPILFIIQDLVENFERIYEEALIKLQHLFHYQPSNRIITYVIDKINDLIYLESNVPKKGPTLNPIIDDLMKHFRSEFERAMFQQKHIPTKMEDLLNQTKIQIKKKLCFGYKKSPGYLTPFISALNARIDFLDPKTSVEDFIRIVSSDDLDTIHEKIYLGCNTNEFKYLLKYFKADFKSLNPATMGKSGIFISNIGNPITAECIYSSRIENMQSKFTIDNIFNKM